MNYLLIPFLLRADDFVMLTHFLQSRYRTVSQFIVLYFLWTCSDACSISIHLHVLLDFSDNMYILIEVRWREPCSVLLLPVSSCNGRYLVVSDVMMNYTVLRSLGYQHLYRDWFLLFISYKFVKGILAITFLLIVFLNWNFHDVCQRFYITRNKISVWYDKKWEISPYTNPHYKNHPLL